MPDYPGAGGQYALITPSDSLIIATPHASAPLNEVSWRRFRADSPSGNIAALLMA